MKELITKDHKKWQKKTVSRRGKVKHYFTAELTAKAKKVRTLAVERKAQRSKNHSLPKGCNAKGKTSTWKRGGEFPANRPRAGWSGRARWTKGNNWDEGMTSPKIYHYKGK